MTAKPKSELMARLRKERADKGEKRLELWAKPENHPKIRAYAEKLKVEAKK